MSEKTSRAWWIWREEELRRGYIEEIVALEAQIDDDSKAELALERSRGDSAEKRAAKSEAERDQLRQQVEKLLGAVEAHHDEASIYCNKCGYFGPDESGGAHPGCDYLAGLDHRDHTLYQAADQVRKERRE